MILWKYDQQRYFIARRHEIVVQRMSMSLGRVAEVEFESGSTGSSFTQGAQQNQKIIHVFQSIHLT